MVVRLAAPTLPLGLCAHRAPVRSRARARLENNSWIARARGKKAPFRQPASQRQWLPPEQRIFEAAAAEGGVAIGSQLSGRIHSGAKGAGRARVLDIVISPARPLEKGRRFLPCAALWPILQLRLLQLDCERPRRRIS